jgi:hypothetical protein
MRLISTAVSHRHDTIEISLHEDRALAPSNILIPPFRVVIGWVAPTALQKVAKLIHTWEKKEIHAADCSHYYRQALGLPCIHEIVERIEANRPLERDQFHPQWWLRTKENDDFQPLILGNIPQISDPSVVKTAGRPRGAANIARANPKVVAAKRAQTKRISQYEKSTKRDPSAFEIVIGGRGRGRGRRRRCRI